MPIYLSMIGWIAFIAVMRYMSYRGMIMPGKVSIYTAIITFGYIIFWIGMRSGVADTATYVYGFGQRPTGFLEIFKALFNQDSRAPLFYAYNTFFKTYISQDYHW